MPKAQKHNIPLMMHFALESSSSDLNASDMPNFSSNFDDRMLIKFFLVTAINSPSGLHPTIQHNEAK